MSCHQDPFLIVLILPISSTKLGGVYDYANFVRGLCSATAANTATTAVSGVRLDLAKNRWNLQKSIPIAFSLTLRKWDKQKQKICLT